MNLDVGCKYNFIPLASRKCRDTWLKVETILNLGLFVALCQIWLSVKILEASWSGHRKKFCLGAKTKMYNLSARLNVWTACRKTPNREDLEAKLLVRVQGAEPLKDPTQILAIFKDQNQHYETHISFSQDFCFIILLFLSAVQDFFLEVALVCSCGVQSPVKYTIRL